MTALTPSAIDSHVLIESVRVEGRHRKDLGDLVSLQRSIREIGYLLHPIVITRDSRLVAGQRRLEACRRLHWVEIPARFVDTLDDAALLLRAELEENTERKEMLPSELASLGETLYALEAEAAKERQRAAGRDHGRGIACGDETTSYFRGGPPGAERNKTRSVVGEALGMSSKTYGELRYVYTATKNPDLPADLRSLAAEELARIDATGSVAPSAARLRARIRARRDAEEARASATADISYPEPEPEPEPQPIEATEPAAAAARPPGALADRIARFREMAATGHTSAQIADVLGYASPETVRASAKRHGIDIHADRALGRNTRKSIDSNRIVRETVSQLEGVLLGIALVNCDELDPAEIKGWADSLAASTREINRLIRHMKEKTQ